MSDVGQVIAQMAEYGMPALPTNHPVLDGKVKRFGPQKKAWYILRELTLDSGRSVITGAFGFFQGENRNTVPIKIDREAMSEADRDQYLRQQRAAEEAETAKREQARRLAANRARDAWSKAANIPVVHDYLVRKQVVADGLRVSEKGELLIPMVRDGQLLGLQRIDAAGAKRYSSDMDKAGTAHVMGKLPGAEVIGLGEGYATCCSVRMAVAPSFDLPVVAAFDAGSIMAVARRLRQKYPKAHLLFLADDDYMLAERFIERLREEFNISSPVAIDGASHVVVNGDGEEVTITAWMRTDPQGVDYIEADMRRGRIVRNYTFKNAGVAACRAAAREVGNASVTMPLIKDRAGRKLTDWNDLHVEEGLESVAMQIGVSLLAAKQPISDSPAPSAADAAHVDAIAPCDDYAPLELADSPPPPGAEQPPEGDSAIVRASTEVASGAAIIPFPAGGAPAAKGGGEEAKKQKPKKEYGPAHWDAVQNILDNFILIYGEDLVWDCRQRMLMKISAMRTIVQNNDVMKFWGGEARKWVLKKNIVFDPTETPSPAVTGPTATVNLFSGWQMKPKKGSCLQIRVLLSHLCDGNEEIETWILRWLAYPLRHPGAKMETSIIMHGDEGSGKNFFFEKVVKAIYGEYGYVIGNAQLESNFNDWASMKLFMVADEVVTRAELKQMKGKLKYLISGDSVIINPKGMPEHAEKNQMNFVFLSNELTPLALDKTDRRYLVLWTPPALSRDFYVGVAKEIEQGGIEAFYHYLMHEVDMGDFNEHTKPLYNDAKDRLIEKSLAPAERFYREWQQGLLPLPFITCGVSQLYEAFKVWCGRSGESKYTSQALFSPQIERYAGGVLTKRPINFDVGSKVKQRLVFLIGDQPADKSLRDWADACWNLFEGDLGAYQHRGTQELGG